MTKKRAGKISTLGSQATSIVSVALVLLILGILASIGIATGRATTTVLGNVSVIVKMDQMASKADLKRMTSYLAAAPFAASSAFTSADEVLQQELEYNSEILELLDENPYAPEYEVRLQPAYVNADSIKLVANQLAALGGVDEVVSQVDMVEAVDAAYRKISWVLTVVAAVLLVISLVLIYNTVSIAVYSRRFVIRTMQLVGATGAFIRRPFVWSGVLSGVLSGLLASGLLLLGIRYVEQLDFDMMFAIPAGEVALVCAGMLVLGIVICTLSSLLATNRYLRASYDQLYS